jgi:sulfonate transport system substrate-binding protein
MLSRRSLLTLASAALASRALASPARTFRIGFQKGEPVLLAAQQRRSFETAFAPLGIDVQWLEFPYGPPLLEAMRVDSIDFGAVGDTPPVFAQAARAELVYVAARPGNGDGNGIVVPPGSNLRSLADLHGKRLAFARGSSAHNLTIAALDKAGLGYSDIQPIYLAPADAAAALARGSIDAWTIWDPYLALAESRAGVRLLANGKDIGPENSFYLARRDYATNQASIIAKAVEMIEETGAWCDQHRDEVAQLLSTCTGVPLGPMQITMHRASLNCVAMNNTLLDQQQQVADRFYRLQLIPRAVNVRDFAWHVAA